MSYQPTRIGVAALVAFLTVPHAAAEPQRSFSDLTGPWQLLVDDFGIEEKSGVVRRYHAFEKYRGNPVAPHMGSRGTILPGADGRGYRKWFDEFIFTSPDGLSWTKAPLVTDFAEKRINSVVMHTPWDDGREYKQIGIARSKVGFARQGAYSQDGVRWMDAPGNPLSEIGGDTGLTNWDPHLRRYMSAPKLYAWVRGISRRSVGFTASSNFDEGWSDPELMLVPDELDDRWATGPGQRTEFYNLSAFAYESMYLGFLEVFHNTDGWKDGHIHIELVSSRDGVRWQRVEGDREPLVPVGPAGAWDSGMIKVPSHPLVEGDEIKLFYAGSSRSHGTRRKEYPTFGEPDELTTHGVGIATLRKDGFASLEAGSEPGTVTTRPVRTAGGVLAVNYAASGGSLKAELLDSNGNVIPGYSAADCLPLTGDGIQEPVAWKTKRELPADIPMRIRFTLRNAALYSYRPGIDARVGAVVPELQVLYTFESDGDRPAVDQLRADGAQRLHYLNAVLVDDDRSAAAQSARPAFGRSNVIFLPEGEHARMLQAQSSYRGRQGHPWNPVTWNVLEVDGTHRLGKQFTLAAMVRIDPKRPGRLFSSWDAFEVPKNRPPRQRAGWIGRDELAVDVDASGREEFGCFRAAIHGREVTGRGRFDDGKYHHLAVTYDDGAVCLYLDGREIGRGSVPGGPVALQSNVHVGGNPGPSFESSQGPPAPFRQFVGEIDDLLVLGRVLSPAEIAFAGREGAAALFATSGRGR